VNGAILVTRANRSDKYPRSCSKVVIKRETYIAGGFSDIKGGLAALTLRSRAPTKCSLGVGRLAQALSSHCRAPCREQAGSLQEGEKEEPTWCWREGRISFPESLGAALSVRFGTRASITLGGNPSDDVHDDRDEGSLSHHRVSLRRTCAQQAFRCRAAATVA
jgi:hypothetical protein